MHTFLITKEQAISQDEKKILTNFSDHVFLTFLWKSQQFNQFGVILYTFASGNHLYVYCLPFSACIGETPGPSILRVDNINPRISRSPAIQ